ncbi:MAG: hypothetical protein UW05_C0008G0026, partial [Candidatus Giovannonibacteria bacterium GW2011_GWC2_43_8]
ETFGSIEELKKRNATSGNKYFIMRHGEAESNIKNIVNGDINKNHYPLTPRGKKQVEVSVKNLLKTVFARRRNSRTHRAKIKH